MKFAGVVLPLPPVWGQELVLVRTLAPDPPKPPVSVFPISERLPAPGPPERILGIVGLIKSHPFPFQSILSSSRPCPSPRVDVPLALPASPLASSSPSTSVRVSFPKHRSGHGFLICARGMRIFTEEQRIIHRTEYTGVCEIVPPETHVA